MHEPGIQHQQRASRLDQTLTIPQASEPPLLAYYPFPSLFRSLGIWKFAGQVNGCSHAAHTLFACPIGRPETYSVTA